VDFFKIKNFSAKDTTKRMRRQDIDWEKIFSKGLFSKRYSKGKRSEQTCHHRRYIDGRQAHEKMLNTISY
jgi:hypothetical protein